MDDPRELEPSAELATAHVLAAVEASAELKELASAAGRPAPRFIMHWSADYSSAVDVIDRVTGVKWMFPGWISARTFAETAEARLVAE